MTLLPDYVVINNSISKKKEVLRVPAEEVTFPLDNDTQEIIRLLEAKFDQEENCGGLAAPQLGYNKRVVVLAVEEDEDLRRFRPDLSDTLPKSIWLNPTYDPISSHKTVDWEACFSVDGLAGRVSRFTEITYEAWTPEGEKVAGKAKGYLARLIQHEIDHLNGKLFIDYVSETELVPRESVRRVHSQTE